MTAQLALLDSTPSWRISEETRRVGRTGLAEARAALHSVPRRVYDDHHLAPTPVITSPSPAPDLHRPAA
ncbi:MAG: hypothetical protein M9952_02995 [Microthrixaceae bacterium]|nr:hypothetical protein [Microthrixaceae bacterium]MCO5311884.1 hypothetical protein [Microthrixaceae bacterium]